MKLEYIVNKLTNYTNIKQILKNEFKLSDRLLLKLKRANKIYCNEKVCCINDKIHQNDKILVDISFEEESNNILPTKMDLNILYEDECMLIVNKPAYMPVHPSLNHFEDSLCNGVKYYFNQIGLKRKLRPANRLDKDTSGIVIFAKNEYIQESLIQQMKNCSFKKEYIALLDGIVTLPYQQVIAPIARKCESIIERCVSSNGDYAETLIELLDTYSNYSLVKCTLKTGRTHQIRVHTKHIGNAILGDDLYGSASSLIPRQALHAYKVTFIHPLTNKKMEFVCKPPQDILNLINPEKLLIC